MRLRFHCQTAAASLTKPQHKVNVIRTTLQALAAVLGGAQSLHTNGMDEAFAIPTEEAMKIALRTQQVIADETNVANVVDPLGGSYYVESLTTEYERKIFDILDEVERRRRYGQADSRTGWFQKHIADFAYETALRKQSGRKTSHRREQIRRLRGTRQCRDSIPTIRRPKRARSSGFGRCAALATMLRCRSCSSKLVEVAKDDAQNLMPVTIELVREGASMGEIVEKLKTLWGTYRETPVF